MITKEKRRKFNQSIALPSLWHKAYLKRLADQEKLRILILGKVDKALKILEKKYKWNKAYLFGSVAQKEKFGRSSDIDLAIDGLNSLDHYVFTGEISELLDKSVDVVLLEECPFADTVKESRYR